MDVKCNIDKFFCKNLEALRLYATVITKNDNDALDVLNETYCSLIDMDKLPKQKYWDSYIRGAIKNNCYKLFKYNAKFIRRGDADLLDKPIQNDPPIKPSLAKELVDNKVISAVAKYGSFLNAIKGIREERRVIGHKKKLGRFVGKIGNKTHVKILYNNMTLWMKITKKRDDNLFGYIETISPYYKKRISVNTNDVIGITI